MSTAAKSVVLSVFAIASLSCCASLSAQEIRLDSRSAVVNWLRHQEEIVRSSQCEIEVKVSGPRPEMKKLIEDVCRLERKTNYYMISEQSERKNSYAAKWWRDGVKERYTKVKMDGSIEDIAFDGQTVRTLVRKEGDRRGAVDTIESANWSNTNRLHPYSLIYLYYERPYSEVVERGTDFKLTQGRHNNQMLTRVQVSEPKEPTFSVVLFFSKDGRMVERQVIRKLPDDRQRFVREIHILSKFESFPSRTGESIQFPRHATYRYNMGVHPNGTLVEYMTEEIDIRDIQFNIDIPKETFQLRIPRDVEVYDSITGLGLLKPGHRPDALFPEEVNRRRWIAIVLVMLAAIVTAAVVWQARRRRAMAGG